MCPLFRGSTVHKEEDNLSIVDKMAGPYVSFIVDKMAGPNVSFILMFHASTIHLSCHNCCIDCDVLIQGDSSISRKHAIIKINGNLPVSTCGCGHVSEGVACDFK